ncbi:hypothetical protein ABBQ32_005714 [Trebouxia sp. C0010 RCD-2024]
MHSPAFSLQRMSAGQAVDWDAVDDELDKIPPELKDPRFDSLRHVLNILSAVDAEAALEELREQRDTIEGLVDEVVQGYHNGFNKAIHNYSQILQLFANCKSHVNTLRTSLQEAKGHLGAQSRNLQQQWRRSITLGDIVRLLADARSVVDVPERLGQLERNRDWTGAVTLLLDSCGKLARQEMSRVGAMSELKRDMSRWQSLLQGRLVEEMEETLYALKGSQSAEEEDSNRRLAPNTPQGLLEAAWKGDKKQNKPSSSDARFAGSFTSKTRPEFPQGGKHRNHAPRGHDTQPIRSTPLPSLVDCLVKLGGVADAQATVHQRLPSQIMKLILRALQTAPADLQQAASSSSSAGNGKVNPAVAAAAQNMVERVYDHCQQVLCNLVQVFKLLADAPAAPVSAGMDLLNAYRQHASPQAPATSNGSQATYVRKETQYAWECIQTGCQKVLVMLLHGQASGAAVAAAAAGGLSKGLPMLAGGWLGKEPSKKPEATQQLTFSFQVQLQDKGSSAGPHTPWQIPASSAQGVDEGTLLRQALMGLDQRGGLYLTPVLYRPTVQFVDGSSRLLSTADRDSSPGWFAKEDTKPGAARSLRMFMESFVTEKFLPEIYLDFRGQCTHMLEDADAMKAHAQLHGTYNESTAKGRPVLHAALQAEKLVGQLVSWAAQMPLFATHITGVVENILGRVLDAFQARMGSLLGSSLCRGLAENPALALQMAAEPAALLASHPEAFFVGKANEPMEGFVKAVKQAGFGSGDDSSEIAVLTQLAQVRPVQVDQLVTASGDMQRLVNLASLCDSLDYLADAMQHFGEGQQQAHHSTLGSMGPQAAAGSYTGRREQKGNRGATVSLTEGLAHLVDRYRALAGQCLRALRIDMHLLALYHLRDLAQSSYACEEDESRDGDDCVGTLSRALARADESVAPYLPVAKRSYIFGGMSAATAHFTVWLLPEIQDWNQHGVARMCYMLTLLRPTLATLEGASSNKAAKHFEKARLYFSLLMYSAEGLQRAIMDKPGRFTLSEYTALLQEDR